MPETMGINRTAEALECATLNYLAYGLRANWPSIVADPQRIGRYILGAMTEERRTRLLDIVAQGIREGFVDACCLTGRCSRAVCLLPHVNIPLHPDDMFHQLLGGPEAVGCVA